MRLSATLILTAVGTAGGLLAQPVIGAKAGLVSYALGNVTVDGQRIAFSDTRFVKVKQGAVLRTGRGLAEVLLGPCSALRLGHQSSFRLVGANPEHPRMELLSGAAVVEISGIAKDADVTLQAKESAVTMARVGVYRVDFPSGLLKVFAGRATVQRDGLNLEVGPGRMLALLGVLPERFDRQPADELDRWSGRRTEELARLRSPAGESSSPALDLSNGQNSAEFARYNNPRRGMQSPEDPVVVSRPRRTPAPSACVAGR
jgi:hypothetical protein